MRTDTKVCGGGWVVSVECKFSLLLWSKSFPSGLSFELGPSRTIYASISTPFLYSVNCYFVLKDALVQPFMTCAEKP